MAWVEISVCDRCGGKWQERSGELVCAGCGQGVSTAAGFFKLESTPLTESEPHFEGQIGAPSDQFLDTFRTLYGPAIDGSSLDKSGLRVLELGAGVGRMSLAFLRLYKPELYIATEPFPSLAATLRNNLNTWDYAWPKGVAAVYNGNAQPLLAPGSINVVIGNSVLHHILAYEEGLEYWSGILASPGLMIFGEPMKEGWAYWLTILRATTLAAKARQIVLSTQAIERLRRHSAVLVRRMEAHTNRALVADSDDKHLFSPLHMLELAERLGLRLTIHKPKRRMLGLIRDRLTRMGLDVADVQQIQRYLNQIVPSGIDDTAMSDFLGVFVLSKD